MAQRGSKPGERRGGRAKGTPNKRTVLYGSVRAALEAEGVDPQVVMAQIAAGRITTKHADLRLRAAAELLQYIAPKYSRLEISGVDGGPVQLDIFESPAERIEGRLAGLVAANAAAENLGGPDAGGSGSAGV